MTTKIYEYANCSTCKQALKFLDAKGIKYDRIAIVDQPPSMKELRQMLEFVKADGGTVKNLFNTSGIQYRELGIADKIKAGLAEDEALQLLSKNGKLIKRPFVLTEKKGTVGFKADTWSKIFSNKGM